MGQAKEIGLRHKIVSEHTAGASYRSLSDRYGINYNTVRSLCLRYKASGESGLIARYGNCGRRVVAEAQRTFRLVRLLKHLHPSWGVGYILVRLRMAYPELNLQSERHYQRRLSAGSTVLPPSRLPMSVSAQRARLPHDTWQIDAKECIGMADGQECCFLNITDEKTAAVLQAQAFSP